MAANVKNLMEYSKSFVETAGPSFNYYPDSGNFGTKIDAFTNRTTTLYTAGANERAHGFPR